MKQEWMFKPYILDHMPSLLNNQGLEFGYQWPLVLKLPRLPPLPQSAQYIQEEFHINKQTNNNNQDSQSCDVTSSSQKMRNKMKITKCPHTFRRHYAKNMCNDCYHKKGRDIKAWLCQHRNAKMYAKGRCVRCYQNSYNQFKKEKC